MCGNVQDTTTSSTTTSARLEADRRAIEALNEHDVRAALSSDIDAIVSQWTDDFVVLPAAGPIVRGRSANAAAAEQGREQMQGVHPGRLCCRNRRDNSCGWLCVRMGHVSRCRASACRGRCDALQREVDADPAATAGRLVEDASNHDDNGPAAESVVRPMATPFESALIRCRIRTNVRYAPAFWR
jgi:hypothetical protein